MVVFIQRFSVRAIFGDLGRISRSQGRENDSTQSLRLYVQISDEGHHTANTRRPGQRQEPGQQDAVSIRPSLSFSLPVLLIKLGSLTPVMPPALTFPSLPTAGV